MSEDLKMNKDQQSLVGSYHDNCSTRQLMSFIGNKEELDRFNRWRKTNWTQEMLDEVIKAAIKLRHNI